MGEGLVLRLNGTEFLDWQECWCFRCEHDHGYSHVGENDAEPPGCELTLGWARQTPVAEFEARDPEWWHFIPAEVSCSKFIPCTLCAPDPPDAERRGGETRREFHDRLRAETLARPVCETAE